MADSGGFGWRLRWARAQAGLSQGELGRRARVSRSTVALVEDGSETGVRKAAEFYEVLARELPGLSLEWFLMGRGSRMVQAPPGSGLGSRMRRYDGGDAQIDPLAGEAPQETPADRITFIRGSIGLALMATSADPVIQAVAHLCSFEGDLTGEAIDSLDGLVADFGLTYSRRPPDVLCSQLNSLLPPIISLIAASPPGYKRRLQSAAGWLTALLANALHDSGNTPAAKVQAAVALTYGQHSGDSRLIAFVRFKQAGFAADNGDVAGALRYVEDALLVAPPNTAISTRLLADKAILSARLAQRDHCLSALSQMEHHHERSPVSEIGNGSFAVSEVFAAGAVGSALRSQGDLEPSARSLCQFIDHYSRLQGKARRPTRQAIAQLELADVMLRLNRPDEACAEAAAALGTDRMILGLLRQCGTFDAALIGRHPDLPEARDFHERYVTLAQQPASATS